MQYKIENLSIDTVIRVICEKELEVGSFVMGFQEYKKAWPSLENKKLNTRMEPESKKDKFTIAVIGGNEVVIGHVVKGKTRRFSKIIFNFLQVSQYRRYNIQITGYAINQGDGKNMKISCMLTFKG